jgi:hypothetical protein
MLYRREGQVRLAPLYDRGSKASYPEIENRLAMQLGGDSDPDFVSLKEIAAFAQDTSLGFALASRRLVQLAERVRDKATEVERPDATAAKRFRLIVKRCEPVLPRFRPSR